MEIKQHATDSQRTNQRKLKSTEKSENRNTAYQNLWDAAKEKFGETFTYFIQKLVQGKKKIHVLTI